MFINTDKNFTHFIDLTQKTILIDNEHVVK